MPSATESNHQQRRVDVAIIGAGTAGMGAYRAARKHSERVVLIEAGDYGTTCARVGCMPSKLLIAAAEAAHQAQSSAQFGVQVEQVSVDGVAVLERVRRERDRFVGFVLESVEDFDEADRLRGYARFVDDHRLWINDEVEVVADRIVIATGSRPFYPAMLQEAGERLLTNDEIFELPQLPQSVAVFGPGVIGLELGQALSRLGVEVKVFGRSGSLANLQDTDIKQYAERQFNGEFYLDTQAEVQRLQRRDDGILVEFLDQQRQPQQQVFEYVLAATGRRANVDQLGLENTSLALDERGVPHFDRYTLQTDVPHIFIAGDANNDIPLLHEAADEGRIAGDNAGRFPDVRAGLRRTPLAIVFTDPQIATVGMSLQQIQQRCDQCYAVGIVDFTGQGRSRVMGKNQGLLKVYGEQGSGLLLGAEMFGPAAEHIAHLLAWSVQQRMTVSQILDMPFYHPVIEEGLRTALRDLNAKLHLGPEMVARCMDCGPGA